MAVPIRSNTPKAEKDLWRTPDELFKEADNRYGPFDLDAAADATNHKCLRWLGPDGLVENALACTWGHDGTWRVWCNPPYSDGMDDAFTYHAWDQVKQGRVRSVTLLIKAATEKRIFHDLIWDRATNRPKPGVIVDFLKARVSFIRPNGKKAGGNTFASMLVTFTEGIR